MSFRQKAIKHSNMRKTNVTQSHLVTFKFVSLSCKICN